MKNLKYFMGALLMSAMVFTACNPEPEPEPGPSADYPELTPVAGKFVIGVKFEGQICNDIVWVGNHNEWKTDPDSALRMVAIDADKWPNWYKVEVPALANDTIMGKAVQLKTDGTFDWNFQTGDSASWTIYEGNVTVKAGYAGEADLTFAKSAEPILMKSAYWKNQGSPCVEAKKHNYTFTVTVPTATPADAVVRIVGAFDAANWTADAEAMILTKGSDGKYTITLNDVKEGTEYKYVLNGSWDYEELQAVVAPATCAKAIENRKTGTSDAISDTVASWKGIDGVTRCE